MSAARLLLDAAGVAAAVGRISAEAVRWSEGSGIALIGVRARGVPLAERVAAAVRAARGEAPPIGILDITLYRDDLGARDWPVVRESRIPFDVAGRTIVLVDDVLYTGRTVRAAVNSLMDYGRPAAVRLAVLVDRGLRELPIRADVAGLEVATRPEDHVRVRLAEIDGADEVVVEARA